MTTNQPTQKRSPNGFAMLVAVAMAAALLATVFAMQNLSLQQSLARSNERDYLIAKQAAEAGLARVQADAYKLSNSRTPDLDCLLDPKLDGMTTTTDNNIPPQAAGDIASGSCQLANSGTKYDNCSTFDPDCGGSAPAMNLLDPWTDADATPVVIASGQFSGMAFRRVKLDMNGDGNFDSAYLVRYDDNRDDFVGGPSLTTNDHAGGSEGSGTDEPLRDRDQNITVTVIGLSGNTDPTLARARRVLRATLRGGGALSYVTPGRALVGGKNSNTSNNICGNGGLFCWVGEASGRTPACACGTITANDNPGEVWSPMVPSCAVPTVCDTCEPLVVHNLDIAKTNPCPEIPAPELPPPLTLNESHWMNNFSAVTPGVCYFYIKWVGAASRNTWIWDRYRAGCNTFTGTTAFPAPDTVNVTNYAASTSQCWAPLSVTGSMAVDGSSTITTADQASRVTALTSAGTIAGKNWSSECNFSAGLTTVVSLALGTGSLVVLPGNNTPNGWYYFDPNITNVNVTGTGGARVAVIQAADSGTLTYSGTGSYIRSPGADIPALPIEKYGLMSKGGCVLSANSSRIDQGVWCEDYINLSANNFKVYGNMKSRGDIYYSGGANNFNISGPTLASGAFPVTTDGSDCPSNAEINGANCKFKNGAVFCADLNCKGKIEIDNGAVIRGTLWAEGNIELANGTTLDPSGDSMLGSRPTIMAVQELGF